MTSDDAFVVVLGSRLPNDATRLLADASIELTNQNGTTRLSQQEFELAVHGADAIISMLYHRVDARVLDSAGPQLRVVANVAVGHDNIDLEAARERGVIVTNTPGVLTDATADLAMALILAVTRRMGEGDRLLRRAEPWGWELDFMLGSSIANRTLGIVGLGQIGLTTARRARAFGMNIVYCGRRRASSEVEVELAARYLSADDLFAESHVVSLHCPYGPDTHHFVDQRRLQLMQSDAYLINTARGPIVDECALVSALEGGGLQGAGLDVYEHEPEVHPGLRNRQDVVLLPHLGSATREVRTAMAVLAVENVLAVRAGRPPLTPV